MTPGELASVITDADAAEPRGKRRLILELRAPSVLGFAGKYLGHEQVPDGQGGFVSLPVYGYTRRDALRMREMIYEAAREDAAARAGEVDDGFGDGVDG